MTDIEERLRQLEDTLTDTESVLQHEKMYMPEGQKCFPYVYIIAGLIPLLSAAALYIMKPSFVTMKNKGKQVVCMAKLLKWVAMISIIGFIGLYLVNYCGALNGAMACFGK